MSLLDIIAQAIASQNSGPFRAPSTPEEREWDPMFGWKGMQDRGEDMRNWAIEPERRANSANESWMDTESKGLANAINAGYELDPGKGLFGFMNSPKTNVEQSIENIGGQGLNAASDARAYSNMLDYLWGNESPFYDAADPRLSAILSQLNRPSDTPYLKEMKQKPLYNKEMKQMQPSKNIKKKQE